MEDTVPVELSYKSSSMHWPHQFISFLISILEHSNQSSWFDILKVNSEKFTVLTAYHSTLSPTIGTNKRLLLQMKQPSDNSTLLSETNLDQCLGFSACGPHERAEWYHPTTHHMPKDQVTWPEISQHQRLGFLASDRAWVSNKLMSQFTW